jgi:hypothetical protein
MLGDKCKKEVESKQEKRLMLGDKWKKEWETNHFD